jgi:outer membrane receptor protein involved in Fe transport
MARISASLFHGVSAATLGLLLASSAWGQAAPAPQPAPAAPAAADDTPPPQEIVVTGTRITGGFQTPTPVTTLTNERSKALVVSNIGDALNMLPAFRPSAGPATQANIGGNVGSRLLDLRGLEPKRTLVLVDGQRFVPTISTGTSANIGAVDVNLIPSALIDHTDIVTGGASAAYGSDAVAGVVNFVLNHKLEGINAEVQSGISQRGDNGELYLSIAGGTHIGDRIHIIGGFEYDENKGLGDCNTRSWCENVNSIVSNTAAATNGLPANLILSGVRTATSSPAGVINSSLNAAGKAMYTTATDPLRGLTFNPDGSTRQFQYGTFVGPLFMENGEGAGRNAFIEPQLLKVPVKRYVGYTSAQADLTDTIQAQVDLSYGRVEGHIVSSVFRDFNGSVLGLIKSGNPYIPANVQAVMTANGIAQLNVGRTGFDIGPAEADAVTQTYRGLAALKGSLGSHWKWDVSYEYGKTLFRQDAYNLFNLQNAPKAVDAVTNGAGQIVCRVNQVTVTDPACAPINLFGENRFSAAAKSYVTGRGFQKTDNDQHHVAANVNGSLFELPAGPLSVAIGAEYRRESISGTADAISQQNGWFALNGSAVKASHVNVKEAYGEVEAPILKESTLGYALNLNGAIRRTDYSTSGAVTTWKFGGVYQPIRAIRLRATKSRDIRAPNLFELNGPLVKTLIGATDPRPVVGGQINPTVLTGSNPNLTPEKADSFTAGVVLAPTGGFARRMRLSVDYYDIKVKNVIGPLGAQGVINACFVQNIQAECNLITLDSNNKVATVMDLNQNSAKLRTRGFDLEFQYRQSLGSFGDLSLQGLANITQELTTADGFDRAGQTGHRTGTIPGVPDYTVDGLLTWSKGNLSISTHTHYIPHGTFWVNFTDPSQPGYVNTSSSAVNNNQVPARIYFDLSGTLKIPTHNGRSMEIFASITNLLDKDPPGIPDPTVGTNQILFDPVGRAFKIGARVHFGG